MQSGLTPLHLAAQEDKVSVAEVLLNHGADVNPQTKVRARLTHKTRTTVTLPDLDFDGPLLCVIFSILPPGKSTHSRS